MADLVQFILVRTDMASMTRGRIAAQCAHTSNQMVKEINTGGNNKAALLLEQWQKETPYGFGTAYIMDAKIADIQRAFETVGVYKYCGENAGLHLPIGNLVVDPSYVIEDGEVIHNVSVVTCAYIFGYKDNIMPKLKELGIGFLKDKE